MLLIQDFEVRQSASENLKRSLVSISKKTPGEKLNGYFLGPSCKTNKIFILAWGMPTRSSFYEV